MYYIGFCKIGAPTNAGWPVKLNREDLAWAAGFSDGEGTVAISKKPGRPQDQIHLVVSQRQPSPLWRFWLYTGRIGTVRGPYKYGDKTPLWQFTVDRFETVQAVIAMLWFKLSGPKRRQAERKFHEYLTREE